MFCPKCESLLYPTDKEMVCKNCGHKQKKNKKNEVILSKRKDRESIILDEKVEVLPKTKVQCPKCSHNEAFWMLRQMRAADEPETRIYRCTKCNYRWREN
jgi:DNA-directed RNA polymerase subunit M